MIKAYNIWYDVDTAEGVVACRPRGRLQLKAGAASPGGGAGRERLILVGDRVRVERQPDGTGAIIDVLPRRSQLVRPPVANVDQVLVVASCLQPPLDLEFVDRVLALVAWEGLAAIIALNKADLLAGGDRPRVEGAAAVYRRAGYPVFVTSATTGEGVAGLREALEGRITVLAGESGVGKSSLLNAIFSGLRLRTGKVSAKAGRGRHTTRHVELLPIAAGAGAPGWVADAPGFTRLDLTAIPAGELASCFPDLAAHGHGCRFPDCRHDEEPGCAVRQAVADGLADRGRYARYRAFLAEIRGGESRR